jgi:1-acyl-sn-glycerol-3-phosphate acyltransferase
MVYLANHQSYFDILALLATVPSQVRFAAKASLFRIPIFGWALTVGGFIPIDRGDRSRARQAFAAAASRLQGGGSVLFFPEGTRSLDGTFGKFERGGFLLALRSGLPILPVGVRDAREVLPRGSVRVRPGKTIRLRFGAAINAAEYGIRRREELVSQVRLKIAELAEIALVE